MSNIKFKPIEPGMVIHCPTEENANELLEYLDGLGYKWLFSSEKLLECTRYDVYGENTCYSVEENMGVTYSDIGYFKSERYEVIEFSDLIEPELTAEEVLSTISEMCTNVQCKECYLGKFCEHKNSACSFMNIEPKVIIDACVQWKADHEKKELEVEWHFYAEVHGNGFDSIKNCGAEKEAIQFVEEELKKAGKDAWGKYERVCTLKAVNLNLVN